MLSIEAVRGDLISRGVEVSKLFHGDGGELLLTSVSFPSPRSGNDVAPPSEPSVTLAGPGVQSNSFGASPPCSGVSSFVCDCDEDLSDRLVSNSGVCGRGVLEQSG